MNEMDAAIYTRLQTTSGLTSLLAGTAAIYHLQAPEGQGYGYVVFNLQGGGDANETPRRRKNTVYFIRGYAASAASAGTIDAQIDTAVHLVPLTVSGWTNIWLARFQDLELVENDPSGRPVYMSGGLYRMISNK